MLASSSVTSRFADIVSPEKFIEGQQSENTRKKTDQNIALLKEFLTLKGECRAVEEVPPDELNSFISEFIITLRKKDDKEDYEPSSLRVMLTTMAVPSEIHIPLGERGVSAESAFMRLVLGGHFR